MTQAPPVLPGYHLLFPEFAMQALQRSNWLRAAIVPIVLLLCTPTARPAEPLAVTGSATYRERMALPPQAVFEATVQDTARADAAARVVATVRIESPQVPVQFTIPVDPARIAVRGRYVVRARITVDGRLLFTSDTVYPVFDERGTRHVDMLLRRVPAAPPRSTARLEGTYWKLMTLRGEPVIVASRQREPHFILQLPQRRLAGSGGCNRLAGGYTLEGERLSFSRAASTMMACTEGMAQERAFLDVLAATARWRIEGERLELFDEQGTPLARFESRYLK